MNNDDSLFHYSAFQWPGKLFISPVKSICLLWTSAGSKEEGTQDADQAEAVAVLFFVWTVFVNVQDQIVQDFQYLIDEF